MATTKGMTRPATDAEIEIFESGNSLQNANNLKKFIREQLLTKNQIISIATCESDIEDGDNVLALYYRKKSIVPGASPLDNIQFEAFNNLKTWEKQLDLANEFTVSGRKVDVLSITRTPKNVGNARCQSAWYTNEAGSSDTFSTNLSRGDGDWQALAEQVTGWLNDYIAPHQLISVSLYEEAHPNNTAKVNCLITHKAGSQPIRLFASAAGKGLPSGGIYSLKVVRAEEVDEAARAAVSVVNATGGQEGHAVSMTNDSQKQDIFACIISWSALLEDQIEEDLRPTGCAGCTIF